MRSTVIWSFLSLVTLAAGGLISGCDSDAKIAKSAEGESCDKTADCNDGLRCRDQVCVKGSGSGGSDSGDGGDGPAAGGSGAAGPGDPGPVLSSEGESCTKRADCEAGLACFNQRCVMSEGEGGGGNLPEVRLGALGETCEVTADCVDGLACIPGGLGANGPIGYQGICGRPLTGNIPTGMDCTAECKTAEDCCELPLAVQVALTPVAESCADLDVALTGVNCAAANVTAANQALCFARETYCNCGANTWSCEAGQCVYGASCAEETLGPVLQTEGCPTFSRSGRPLFGCNEDLECAPAPAGDPLCEANADCDGLLMTDLAVACEEGECTCYQESACYRTCYVDLDCAPGKVCDADAGVCVPEAQCANDTDCGTKVGFGPRYRCVEDMCQLSCASDFECNGNVPNGINTLVCAPDGICRAIGCSADSQCSSGANNTGVKMFCTAPEAVVGGVAASSAITGGHQP